MVVWIHGKLGAAEKVSRTKEFVTDGSMRVLIGTKLVTEGIDIKQLMMVIMLDNRLNIIELIQGVGRLRDGGGSVIYYLEKTVGRQGIVRVNYHQLRKAV